jgi:hypothetical protein
MLIGLGFLPTEPEYRSAYTGIALTLRVLALGRLLVL